MEAEQLDKFKNSKLFKILVMAGFINYFFAIVINNPSYEAFAGIIYLPLLAVFAVEWRNRDARFVKLAACVVGLLLFLVIYMRVIVFI